MAIKTRAELFDRFKTDDFPTQQDFTDWRDSFLHITEDKIPVLKLDGNPTQFYKSDAEAAQADGLEIGDYYQAHADHEDGVREGSICRINFL